MPSFEAKLAGQTTIQLNEDQKRCLEHIDGPALTLAVPGSGKTTMLLCRTLYLIEEQQIDPKKILTLSFTKASAKDMLTRYLEEFGAFSGHALTFSTFHRFCYGLLRKYYGKHTLIEGGGPIQKTQVLIGLYKKINGDTISEDQLEELMSVIGYHYNAMVPIERLDTQIKHVDRLIQSYREIKRENRWIDFDDMLLFTHSLLTNRPEIADQLSERYHYLQVDEAQDISRLQHEILRILAGKRQNLFMVGDEDQSIYGFRGADPDYLLRFREIYPGATVYYLSTNYRSNPEIIELYAQLIQKNSSRYDKQIHAGRDSGGSVEAKTFDRDVELESHLLKAFQREGSHLVLYRNHLMGYPLAMRLENENLHYYIKDKGKNPFSHWITRDILDFLHLALMPDDLEIFERIAFKTNGYISHAFLDYLRSNAFGQTVFDSLLKNPALKKMQRETLVALEENFSRLAKASPAEAMELIKHDLGYLDYVDRFASYTGAKKDTLIRLLDLLDRMAAEADSTVDFIDRIKREGQRFHHRQDPSAPIWLSTIHASKGLEADHVYVIGLETDSFPSEQADLEEERRLLYVALSRARNTLEILHADLITAADHYLRRSSFFEEVQQLLNARDFNTHINEGHVHHKHFGEGKILSDEGPVITVAFGDDVKKLSKSVLIGQGLLLDR